VGGTARSTGAPRGASALASVNVNANWSKEIFGWMKTIGGFRRTRYIGLERTQLAGYFVAAAYNLVRIAKLAPAALAS